MPSTVTLHPYAKINLTLRVGPRLANGFHDIRSIIQAIDVSDTLTITPRPGPFVLATNSPDAPADKTNLVWRAAQALWRFAGRHGDPIGVQIKLEKTIPTAAGLGGGSADAAATLVALNEIWNLRISRPELVRLAAELGSDVPYFLVGGAAIATGRGEEVLPLPDIPRFGVVVIKPAFGVATADAYRWLDEDRAAGLIGVSRTPRQLEVGWPAGPIALINDLEDPVSRRRDSVTELVEACLRSGAQAAAMTGSGSAVFGLFPEAVTPRAARTLRRPDWLVLSTRTLSRDEAGRRVGL